MPEKKNPSLILPNLPDEDKWTDDLSGPPPIPGDASWHELCTMGEIILELWYDRIQRHRGTKNYEMVKVLADQAACLIGDFHQMVALLCAGAPGDARRRDLTDVDEDIMKQLTDYNAIKSLEEHAKWREKNGYDDDEEENYEGA